jgi:beta-galactosidase GanA
MNLYWHYRAHPNGHELAHGALFSTAGRPYRVSEEVTRASEDFEKCAAFLERSKIKSRIALHYSSTAETIFDYAPMLKNFHYRTELLRRFYSAFKHYNVDIIDPSHSLDGYEVLFSPFLLHIDEAAKQSICAWVEQGGTWIVGPMSDMMTADGSKYSEAPFSFLEDYAGVYTRYQKPIANDVFRGKWADGGETMKLYDYYDAYRPVDSRALISYDGGEFDGYAVATEKKIGRGRVILLGSVLPHGELRRLAGIAPIAEASENVRLVERSGDENGLIALEVAAENGFLVLDGAYTDLISGQRLEGRVEMQPHRVLVLRKA